MDDLLSANIKGIGHVNNSLNSLQLKSKKTNQFIQFI